MGAFQQAELELPEKTQRFHSNSMVTGKSVRSNAPWMPSLHSLPAWKQLALNVHVFFRAARGTLQSRFTCHCGVAAGSPAVAFCQWNKSFVCNVSVFCKRKTRIFLNRIVTYLLSLPPYHVLGNKRESSRALRNSVRSPDPGYSFTLLFFSFHSNLNFFLLFLF